MEAEDWPGPTGVAHPRQRLVKLQAQGRSAAWFVHSAACIRGGVFSALPRLQLPNRAAWLHMPCRTSGPGRCRIDATVSPGPCRHLVEASWSSLLSNAPDSPTICSWPLSRHGPGAHIRWGTCKRWANRISQGLMSREPRIHNQQNSAGTVNRWPCRKPVIHTGWVKKWRPSPSRSRRNNR